MEWQRTTKSIVVVAGLALVALVMGCQESGSSSCGTYLCPPGLACAPTLDSCVLPERLTACDDAENGDACSYPDVANGVCFGEICFPEGCGNGELETGEVCDDGNRDHGDGCNADCTSNETCGNGFVDIARGESCDDGNLDEGDGCTSACVLPTCGDGHIDFRELEDGTLVPAEECDDGEGNSDAPDANCRRNCQLQRCSDGIVDVGLGEECDDGNLFPGDGCTSGCVEESCGNGQIDFVQIDDGSFLPAEECDPGVGEDLNHDGCTRTCELEAPIWNDLLNSDLPTARHSHAMVYVASTATMFSFGGQDPFGKVDETRAFDGVSGRWSEILPVSNVKPTARQFPGMAYDSGRNKVVLFGGLPGNAVGDTWEFDVASGRWTEITPVGDRPSPRRAHAMVYDSAREKTILFGGADNVSANAELWEYDGPTSTWTDITPAGDSPSPRIETQLVYDPFRGRILTWGGSGINGDLDVWEYDAAVGTWSQIAAQTATPTARRMHGMVFDPVRRKVYVYGGFAPGLSDELWEYDPGTASWIDITSAGTAPLARSRFGMGYDIARQKMVVFGGQVGASFNGETWDYDPATGEWLEVVPNTTRPSSRRSQVMAYDSARGRVVMFSGSGGANETWEFSGRSRTWTRIFPTTVPSAREEATMVYDTREKKFVMFGGFFGGDVTAETWVYDGETGEWEQRVGSANTPPARLSHSMTFDEARGVVVLFGGNSAASRTNPAFNLNDTWEYDTASDTWTEITVPAPLPDARRGHQMIYDPTTQTTILFGGATSFTRNDTWEFDGATGTWAEIVPTGVLPPPRASHGMAYNHHRRTSTIFGGNNSGTESDVWEYDNRTQSWTDVTPTVSPALGNGVRMTTENLRGGILQFGGLGDGGANSSDTLLLQHVRGEIRELCAGDFDTDSDGLLGCADPDCWGFCIPECTPGSTPSWPADCDTTSNACGDGVCNAQLETTRLCPSDCGAPTALCGNFLCEANEDQASCPGDCTP